jgi:cephalosporin-C deacetylase-like acetyl esterase
MSLMNKRRLLALVLALGPLVVFADESTNSTTATAPAVPAASPTPAPPAPPPVAAVPAKPAGPVVTVVPDKPSAVYQIGEKISWTVTFKGTYDNPAPPTTGSYVLKKGGATVIGQGPVVFAGNTAAIETTLNEPGTIRAEVSLPVPGKRPVQGVGGAAVAPDKIQRSAPCPDDFDAFWKSKLAELAQVPENPVLVKEDIGNRAIDYWKITLDNIRGTHIQGQFARPVGDKKCPAMVVFQYAGVYALDKHVVARASDGWLILNINAHDLPIDQPPAFYADQASHALKNYTAIGDDDREQSYFLRMILGCCRAVDYISERPDWDGKTLVVTGTSQGGYQSFAAAALNPKVTEMMALVPAGCDNTGDLVGRRPGWPYWMANAVGKDPAKARATSLYYDAVNFAARVKCPSLIGLGLIDPTAAPSGVLAAVNQMTGPKEVLILPGSDHYGHGGTQQPFASRSARWREALQKGDPLPLEQWNVSAN